MANVETALGEFLEERANSWRRFVVEAVPEDDKLVRVTLVSPGMVLSCDTGITVPVKSIKSIRKTGERTFCGGKSHPIVELTFSSDRLLTYEDLFSSAKEMQWAIAKNVSKLISLRNSGCGVGCNNDATDSGSGPVVMMGHTYGTCMVKAMLEGPDEGFDAWMDHAAKMCAIMYD
jgi:hypothetical protein